VVIEKGSDVKDTMIVPKGQYVFLVNLPEVVHTSYCDCHHDIPEPLRRVMVGTTTENGSLDQATLQSIDGVEIEVLKTVKEAETPFPYFEDIEIFMKIMFEVQLMRNEVK
jgi:hypothetical protein